MMSKMSISFPLLQKCVCLFLLFLKCPDFISSIKSTVYLTKWRDHFHLCLFIFVVLFFSVCSFVRTHTHTHFKKSFPAHAKIVFSFFQKCPMRIICLKYPVWISRTQSTRANRKVDHHHHPAELLWLAFYLSLSFEFAAQNEQKRRKTMKNFLRLNLC